MIRGVAPDKKLVAGIVTTPHIEPTIPQNKLEQNSLKITIENALLGTSETYGIVIINLKTGEYYLQNENSIFETASLYKLWVMAAVFEEIYKGKLNLEEVINDDIVHLYTKFHLSTPSANEKLSLKVTDAIEKMITVSDNDAALLLSAKIRLSNIKLFLNNYGFADSKLGNNDKGPITTPHNIAIFFKGLYEGKIIDQANSDQMLSILKRQRLNTKLPKYLPDGISTAHKTGELNEFTHDAGIVFAPKGDYIIVVLTEGKPESRFMTEERIANLSVAVYNYFTQ